MDIKQQVINLCNQSVAMMEQRKYNDAIKDLVVALKMLNTSLTNGVGTAIDNNNEARDMISLDECIVYSYHASRNTNTAAAAYSDWTSGTTCAGYSNNSNSSSSNDSGLFTYKHGITLPAALLANRSQPSFTYLSVVVLFNISLAYQLYSEELPQDDERRDTLKKSAKLYAMCYNMVETEAQNGSIHSSSCLVLAISIFNNMGVIHNLMGDMDGASKCFENALSMIMVIVDNGGSGYHSEYNAASIIPQLEGFLHNAGTQIVFSDGRKSINTASAA